MPANVTRQAASKSCWPARILSSADMARASRISSRYSSSIRRWVSGGGEYSVSCSLRESELASAAIRQLHHRLGGFASARVSVSGDCHCGPARVLGRRRVFDGLLHYGLALFPHELGDIIGAESAFAAGAAGFPTAERLHTRPCT